MKKSILILFMFLSALSINAQEPVIKIYMNGGSSKEYKINDIADMSFIRTNLSYSMTVFQSKLNSKSDFDIKTIDSIDFENNQTMNIIQSGNTKSYIISEIDSIIFTFNTCTEIQIGSQIWMCRNLDVDHYRNGDPIPEVLDSNEWAYLTTGAWCYYNNSDSLGKIYGKLYNWYAVNDSRGLAPIGYHVPSDAEWTILETYLSINSQYWCNFNSSYLAKSLASKEKWLSYSVTCAIGNNLNANNSSGFSALPSSGRDDEGGFNGLSNSGYWWSATEYYDTYTWIRYLYNNSTLVNSNGT